MKKCLLLLSSVDSRRGGIQRYNFSLIRMIKAAGMDPVVLSVNDTTNPDPQLENFTGFGRKWSALIPSLIRLSFSAPVILIGHRNFLPLVPLIRLCRPFATIILITHGIEVWSHQPFLYRMSLLMISRIWSVSSYTRDQVRNRFRTQKPISLIPNVVPEAIRLQAEKGNTTRQETSGPLVFLSVSRLMKEENYKGLDMAIPAVLQWAGEQPFIWHLVIQGNDTDRHRLLAMESGKNHQFVFHENLSDSDLKQLYSLAHVFILPSTGEGFGIVFLEAMAHGAIAIGAATGGTPDVISDGVNGLLVPVPVTVEGIIGTLNKLNFPQDRIRLAENGLAMLSRFTESAVTTLIRKELGT